MMRLPLIEKRLNLIHVPQAGYAVITPETSVDYDGLVTTGVHNCCAIMGRATTKCCCFNLFCCRKKPFDYLYLCHAHMDTPLDNKQHGPKAWIEFLIRNGCQEIEILCDTMKPTVGRKSYYERLEEIRKEIKMTYKAVKIKLTKIDPKKNTKCSYITRDKYEYLGSLPLDEIKEESLDMDTRLGPIANRGYPPVCIYDGKDEVTLRLLEVKQPEIFKKLVVLNNCQCLSVDIDGISEDKLTKIVAWYEKEQIEFHFIVSSEKLSLTPQQQSMIADYIEGKGGLKTSIPTSSSTFGVNF